MASAEKRGLAKGLEEGLEKGLEEGHKEGLAEGKQEIARKMQEKGYSSEEIQAITGLSL